MSYFKFLRRNSVQDKIKEAEKIIAIENKKDEEKAKTKKKTEKKATKKK